ncbi:MAG: DUF4131 domain-containing protein, partial [Planctomycetota bacterium]
MRLVPLAAVALTIGLIVHHPLPAAGLFLPSLLHPRLRPLRVLALAFLAGAILPSPPTSSPLLRTFPEGADLVLVEGRVVRGADLPARGGARLDLAVTRVGKRALPGRVRLLLPPGAPRPSPGARVAAIGRLLRPRPAENPGEADPRRALLTRGITHLLAVRAAPSLRIE